MKVRIEVEYWVVDREGRLTSADGILDAHEYVVPEFVDSLVEIVLPPAATPAELEREFRDVLTTVLDAASAAGVRLVPLGTPLLEESSPIRSERGRILERIHGERLRFAKNCAGTHVHFDAVWASGSAGSANCDRTSGPAGNRRRATASDSRRS